MKLTAAVATLGLLAGCAAEAKAPVTPTIGRLNPAVTQATVAETICRRGWAQSVRPSSAWSSKVKRSQLPAGASAKDYQLDHIIPLGLGGAPKDPGNLRLEPLAVAKKADVIETRLQRQVCAGKISLSEAQREIAAWKQAHG